MPDLADLLERESRRVDLEPGGLERLARRRDHRERSRRVVAGALALVVAVAAVAALLRADGTQGGPAGPSPTPNVLTVLPGMPPEGAKPSEPVTGTLELSYDGPDGNGDEMDLHVYSDGRIIWQRWSSDRPLVIPQGSTASGTGYVWQRLTPAGVARLRSTILATGLFDRDTDFYDDWNLDIVVRTGGRLVEVTVTDDGTGIPTRTAQLRALRTLSAQLADPATLLPASDWADTRIHAFVPACYWAAYERGVADLDKLTPAARAELSKQTELQNHAYEMMTTDATRALLEALIPAYGTTGMAARMFGISLPPARGVSWLHVQPALPDRGGC